MRAATAFTFVAVAALSSPALADQEGTVISPDVFRALVEGRTVHYIYEGEYYGSERFHGQDRSTWQTPSGSCEQGRFWDVELEVCFKYGTTSCWKVYAEGDSLKTAISRDGFTVQVEGIDDAPLRCEGNPIS